MIVKLMTTCILELAEKCLVVFKFYSKGDRLEGERLIRVHVMFGYIYISDFTEKNF